MQKRQKTELLILHCSGNQAGCPFGVKEIRDYHINHNGWSDIAYHFVIKQDGTLESGRDIELIGAHCEGHNYNSIGICLVGGIDAWGNPQNNFTIFQFDTLKELCLKLIEKYGDLRIFGHNDFSEKDCPVFSVKEFCERDEKLRRCCRAGK